MHLSFFSRSFSPQEVVFSFFINVNVFFSVGVFINSVLWFVSWVDFSSGGFKLGWS